LSDIRLVSAHAPLVARSSPQPPAVAALGTQASRLLLYTRALL